MTVYAACEFAISVSLCVLRAIPERASKDPGAYRWSRRRRGRDTAVTLGRGRVAAGVEQLALDRWVFGACHTCGLVSTRLSSAACEVEEGVARGTKIA